MNQNSILENETTTSMVSLEDQHTTRKFRVENSLGLHARPAASLVRLLRDAESSVTFTFRKQTVDARSVLGVLMLGAPKSSWITVSVDGPDAVETMTIIEDAFRDKFGEQV
jgi:phosphocarrier protein HPr